MSERDKPRLAVALIYEKPHAPRVVAKGRGELGQAIIDTARKHGVPMEENPGLAEALSHVELDEQIPRELYRAVAAVLGFILRASGQVGRPAKPQAGARPLPKPVSKTGSRSASPARAKPLRPYIRP